MRRVVPVVAVVLVAALAPLASIGPAATPAITIRLAPGAAVRVFPVAQQLQLQPGAKTTTYSFALLSGRVDVSVPSKPKSAVLCSIGKLSTVVGSGQATLLARGEVTTVVSVEGDVRTLLDDRWQTLAPGTLARFGAEHHGVPESTIAAPRLSTGQRLWFSAGEAVAISGFGFESELLMAMYAVTDGFSGLFGSWDTPGTGMNFLVHNMCRRPGSDVSSRSRTSGWCS